MPDPVDIYDRRYAAGYREHLSGYEIARSKALEHFLVSVVKQGAARSVLDYGAGSGLFVPLWERVFPRAELGFCDPSPVARERFRERFPRHADRYSLVEEDRAGFEDGSFDVVVSVEVMEHVESLAIFVKDIWRVLRPGGTFVWTTPCANALSMEHLFAMATGRIEPTPDGFRRWAWEDPAHLRRLRSREIERLLRDSGFRDVRFRFRAHLLSFVCTHVMRGRMQGLGERLMELDYLLFRRLPSGASMLGAARAADAGHSSRTR